MKIFFLLLFILYFQIVLGQSGATVDVGLTLNSVSLLSVKPSNSTIDFQFSVPSLSGTGLTNTLTNNTKWLNFTSGVAQNISRKVTAQIANGSIPSGLTLSLQAGTAVNSFGTFGTSSGLVVLSNTPVTIINSIGGAYTGVGVSNGYNLQFSLSINNYSQLRQGTNSFSIIYTLSDN